LEKLKVVLPVAVTRPRRLLPTTAAAAAAVGATTGGGRGGGCATLHLLATLHLSAPLQNTHALLLESLNFGRIRHLSRSRLLSRRRLSELHHGLRLCRLGIGGGEIGCKTLHLLITLHLSTTLHDARTLLLKSRQIESRIRLSSRLSDLWRRLRL